MELLLWHLLRHDILKLVSGCKQSLQNVCEWKSIYSNNNTINTINTNVPSFETIRNNNNIINTINTEVGSTWGSGKKYKNCCGK